MKYQQQGLTLIEMMISLLIGVFLIGGILQIFVSTQQTYRVQENLSRMQENGRFAMQFLTRDIRMADYWGCVQSSKIESKLNPSAVFDPFGSGIAGVDNDNGANDGDADNDENGNGIWDGADSLTLRGAVGGGISVQEEPTNVAASLKIDDDSGLAVNDIVIISDCNAGDIFQIGDITGGTGFDNIIHNTGGTPKVGDADYPGNVSANLEAKLEVDATGPHDAKYDEDSNIYKMQFIDYRIAISGDGIPSLSRRINVGAFQALVDDIEDMQILYGADTNNDNTPNYYVPAGTATLDMDQVVSIRITLLIRSTIDNLASAPVSYKYNGATVTPTDNRLRRVFSSTIAVRNRLP